MIFASWSLRTGKREAFAPAGFLRCTSRVLGLWLQGMMGEGGRGDKCVWPAEL